jgi:predicted neutral ceramidase superfamily lipid hydrolase
MQRQGDRVQVPLVQEDLDRELDEFLGEVRVMLPAVTVLFAFLLTVPFTARFPQLALPTRTAYFVAFVTTAIAIVLLVGETGYHRLRGKP